MKRKWDSPGPSTMSASADDSNSSSGAEFEVFLSFRGSDTRLNFTDSLYHSLLKAGIRVFRDNEEIRQGQKIGDELLHAIKSSKIYVPIFSRNYASSVWCLREITHMVECSSKAKDKMILPIFYDVNPDDVKLRTQLYLDALGKHEEKFGRDVPQWKEALTEVARIRGLDLKDKGHGEIINAIIDEVVTKLMKRRRNLPNYLVGIHDQVEAIVDLLKEGSCDFRYLVIHGMGGIGKTTLTSAVFNRISNQFEGCSFLLDVRESMQRGRIIDLQRQLLSEILRGRSLENYNSVDVGINIIRERFRDKKVLLVIDDVDNLDQLSKLAGKSDWFGPGSKIIITTRDINFLPIKEEDQEISWNQAHPEEFKFYEMTTLDSFYALKLFSQHALGMDLPPPHHEDISRRITNKAGGLPLALEVIGSSLFGKGRAIWKDTLKKLDLEPKHEVFVKLKISYDMLDHAQREIFLDIACYFIGKEKLHPYYMWKASNYFPKTNLLVLARMSLIKTEEDGTLWMHDQLRDFGREIIRLEDNDPRKHSRLWMPDIALNVVQRKLASNKIVALRLTGLSKVQNFTSEEFSKLPNLRFLELDGGNLVGDFKNLLSKLTWLSWSHCPSKLKAKNLSLEKLVVLELSGGDLGDWAGWEQCMVSNNLKVIHIGDGRNLGWTPNFSKCENLKRFVFRNCSTTPLVDGSLSKLEHLKHLEIKGTFSVESDECNLFTVPSAIGGLRSLSTLYIENMNVEEIHHSIGEMVHLKCLSFANCLLRKIPDSIGKLKSLLELDLGWTNIVELPHCIGDLKKLTKLSLCGTLIKKLPNSIGGLESLLELDLKGTKITELPHCINDLKKLTKLSLCGTLIKKLPNSIGGLESLLELDLKGTKITKLPRCIEDLKKLTKLSLCGTPIKKLPNSIEGLESLLELNLTNLDITKLPACVGNLKRLEILYVHGSAIRELPETIGMLENLKELYASECKYLEGEIPNEIGALSFLRMLDLSRSKIRKLPTSMNRLSHLQQLCLNQCDKLEQIPKLPMSLKILDFPSHLLWTGIDLSYLTNLVKLSISNDTPRLSGLGDGAPNIEWIKGLSKLESLILRMEDVMFSLNNLATLSRLRYLLITCIDPRSLIALPSSLNTLALFDVKSPDVKFDDVLEQQLEKLGTLFVNSSELLERLSGFSRLKGLKELRVAYCPRLMEIQGAEKLESLEFIFICDCRSLKRLSGLSELKKLRELYLEGCPSLILPDLPLQTHVTGRRQC